MVSVFQAVENVCYGFVRYGPYYVEVAQLDIFDLNSDNILVYVSLHFLPISPCSVIEHISKMIIPPIEFNFCIFMVAFLLKFYEESGVFSDVNSLSTDLLYSVN